MSMQVTMISLDDAENGIRDVCAEDAARPMVVVRDDEPAEAWCPDFTDAEIGAIVSRVMEEVDYVTIADELGMDVGEVRRCMLRVRRRLVEQRDGRRNHHAFGEKSTRPPHRQSSLTPEQQERVRKLRSEGETIAQIAREVGCKDGAVRYILSKVTP